MDSSRLCATCVSMSQQEDGPARPLYDAVEETRIRRGWTKVQLARRLGMNRGTVENWKTQPRPPQPGTVRAVAERLGLDPDRALRLAGILPVEEPEPQRGRNNDTDYPPGLSKEEREIWDARSYTEDERWEIIRYLRFRRAEQRAEEADRKRSRRRGA